MGLGGRTEAGASLSTARVASGRRVNRPETARRKLSTGYRPQNPGAKVTGAAHKPVMAILRSFFQGFAFCGDPAIEANAHALRVVAFEVLDPSVPVVAPRLRTRDKNGLRACI